MAVVQCGFGHFYDSKRYKVCPVCEWRRQDNSVKSDDKTVAAAHIIDSANDLTVAYTDIQQDSYVRPVVGWLVCIKGAEKGRDWRLTAGRNFVGGSFKADITVSGFAHSVENAFSVIFDSRHQIFLIAPGVGAQVYLNGELLVEAVQLEDDDEISAEEMVLCFRSFCRLDKRRWE